MSKTLQLRRGTAAETDAFTGAEGELTYCTDTKELRIHDGVTAGGKTVASNVDLANADLSIFALNSTFDGTHEAGADYELEFLNQVEDSLLAIACTTEAQAETNRMLGATGIFGTRSYTTDMAFDEKERAFGTNFNALGIHNHPNYRGMPGFAELSAMVNGYYVRTRHNDYRIFGSIQKTQEDEYLPRKEILAPDIPDAVKAMPIGSGLGSADPWAAGTQYEYMKNVYTNNPEDCVYYLSYLEVWWEELDIADIGDYTASFRHTTNAGDLRDMLGQNLYLSTAGHKNRLENLPFTLISVRYVEETGEPKLVVLRHRVNTFPVATLAQTEVTKTFRYGDVDVENGSVVANRDGEQTFTTTLLPMPFNEAEAVLDWPDSLTATNAFTIRKDLNIAMRQAIKWNNPDYSWEELINTADAFFNLGRDSSDGRLTNLLKLCERIPGLDGEGAVLQESFTDYGLTDTVTDYGTAAIKNAAYYNHRYSMLDDDAAGRANNHRGFNDPNLLVAKCSDPRVVDGYSYMVPIEMILRSPREHWDPYNVLADAKPTGTGTETDPYSNANIYEYFFMMPPDLFDAIEPGDTDPANTANSGFVQTTDGVKQLLSSGVKIFDYDGMRRRFPVAVEYHDFSKAAMDLELYKKAMASLLRKIVNGSATVDDVNNVYYWDY